MIVKIAGQPVEGLNLGVDIKQIDLGIVKDAYHVIHTPLNLDVQFGATHLLKGDANIFNIPKHIYHIIGDIF